MQEPNPEDPLNKEAAEVLQNNKRLFEHNVTKAMRGGYIGETYFERCLKWYQNVSDMSKFFQYCVYLIILTIGGRYYMEKTFY